MLDGIIGNVLPHTDALRWGARRSLVVIHLMREVLVVVVHHAAMRTPTPGAILDPELKIHGRVYISKAPARRGDGTPKPALLAKKVFAL